MQVAARTDTAAHFGRREIPPLSAERLDDPAVQRLVAEHFDEAADYVEVLRRLWDSWEDDAEIRDVATGRFIDRDKLHYIDFEGRWFSVKGPVDHAPPAAGPAGRGRARPRRRPVPADRPRRPTSASSPPATGPSAAGIVAEIRAEQARPAGQARPCTCSATSWSSSTTPRPPPGPAGSASTSWPGVAYTSDAHIFAGTPAELADLLLDWQAAGLTGFRLRPAALPHDLDQITGALVPELQRRGAFRTAYPAGGGTLRGLLGLPRPANRYAPA